MHEILELVHDIIYLVHQKTFLIHEKIYSCTRSENWRTRKNILCTRKITLLSAR